MPRYIDSDWIYQMVENRYRVSSGIEHRCERDLLDLICQAPTADVVPKREVEKPIIDRNAARLGMIAEHERLKMARSDVAREIFAEIDERFVDILSCIHGGTLKAMLNSDKEAEEIHRNMLTMAQSIRECVAELKKKYT